MHTTGDELRTFPREAELVAWLCFASISLNVSTASPRALIVGAPGLHTLGVTIIFTAALARFPPG